MQKYIFAFCISGNNAPHPGEIRMDFIEKIRYFQSHAKKQIEHGIETEEATKLVLVQPFLRDVLGYDTNNIAEVVPEYGANRGGKKDEKVDYAILKDDKPIILIECKKYGTNLDNEPVPQLASYFSFINSNEQKYAILTDGIIYRFYTDLVSEHILDSQPFFESDMLKIKDPVIAELEMFSKPLDPAAVKDIARKLEHMRKLGILIKKEFENPSEKFVRFLANQVYPKNVNDKVIDQFTELTKKALDRYIVDRINDRLALAIPSEGSIHLPGQNIGTMKKGLEEYYIIKTLLNDVADSDQIIASETENSLDIIYDDGKSQKVICRLYLNDEPKSIGLFDENGKETKDSIDSIEDIYKYSDQIISIIKPNDEKSFVFKGQTYKIKLWKDMLPKVCSIMLELGHKDEFEKVLEIKGPKNNYFSKNPDEFKKYGKKIEETDIFVNTNIGPWDNWSRSKKVIAKFGYPEDDLKVMKFEK